MGDFNMPEITWPAFLDSHVTESSQLLVDLLSNSHVSQIVSEPTRFRQNQRPSLLDLIITSNRSLLGNLTYLSPIGNSDHVVLESSIQICVENKSRKEAVKRKYTNFTSLDSDLLAVDWDTLLNVDDIELCWNIFKQNFFNAVNLNSHYKTVVTVPSKPWINEDIMAMIRHKRALWQRFRRSRSDEEFQAHRLFSNHLSLRISRARNEFEQGLAASNDPKKLYKYIRCQLDSKVAIPQLRRADGSISSNHSEVANLFADTFSQTYTVESSDALPNIYHLPRVPADLTYVVFQEEQIAEKIRALDPLAAPGIDEISCILLKACINSICKPLSIIMNLSFTSGILPSDWKQACVKAIFKKGDKFSADNFRPISLTSVAVKMMESIVVDSMRPFLLAHQIIPAEQHGFVPGRSVDTNLLCCVSDWSLSLDRGECVDIVYLDFRKAFDKVPKYRLLQKLEQFGIRGNLLMWIQDFLTDRTFFVKVGTAVSDSRNVLSGVPQGSVLGPLLFIAYTSDLRHFIKSSYSLYADDTKIYCNPLTDHAQLQEDLDLIQEWSESWLLPLNFDKCVVLHLGKQNPRLGYNINGEQLLSSDSHDDLGVIITHNLSWSNHIARQVKKANTKVYLLNKAFVHLNPTTLSKLYKTYIRPVLEFANSVWFPTLMRDSNILEGVQRRITRLPFGRIRPCYEDRLAQFKLTSLAARRRRGDLITTYKGIRNDLSPIHNLFTLANDDRLRGHPFKITRDPFRTSVREHFLSVRVFDAWNTLPPCVVSAPSVNSFKSRYDRLVLP